MDQPSLAEALPVSLLSPFPDTYNTNPLLAKPLPQITSPPPPHPCLLPVSTHSIQLSPTTHMSKNKMPSKTSRAKIVKRRMNHHPPIQAGARLTPTARGGAKLAETNYGTREDRWGSFLSMNMGIGMRCGAFMSRPAAAACGCAACERARAG